MSASVDTGTYDEGAGGYGSDDAEAEDDPDHLMKWNLGQQVTLGFAARPFSP